MCRANKVIGCFSSQASSGFQSNLLVFMACYQIGFGYRGMTAAKIATARPARGMGRAKRHADAILLLSLCPKIGLLHDDIIPQLRYGIGRDDSTAIQHVAAAGDREGC